MTRRHRPRPGTAALPPVLLLVAALAAVPGVAAAPAPATPDGAPPLFAPLTAGDRLSLPPLDPEVPSPALFLGHPLGERFTRYAEIRAYLERLAAVSDRVTLWDYGSSYEGRPLTLLAISSAANLARLGEIRAQRVLLADPAALSGGEREDLAATAPAVVWLAYGVHGNESSSAEAALATAYVLAAAEGDATGESAPEESATDRLDELVVLIDPLSNPDGRERYVAAFQQRRGRLPDADGAALEHREPWPGGRYNHYLFDLNRDWSWATQRETRHRLRELAVWQPQVVVDLHEMSAESTYFFPPSAEPVNPEIDPRVVRWLDVFGRGNAAAFDRLGWLYYKAESFDLFYPGYADSYTSFRGAVGMTYEVGGGGRAGLALRRPDGSLVTLADRAARHFVASLATVETAARERRRLVADYLDARLAQTRRAHAPTYLWPADHPEGAPLAALLARHGVEVRRLESEQELEARRLLPADRRGAARHRFAAGTWAASAAQPQGNLLRALMEPEIPMSEGFLEQQRRRVEQDLDPGFYDVTAWSLPLAFNVETWAATATPRALGPALPAPRDADDDGDPPPDGGGAVHGDGNVGWLIPTAGLATYRSAARLQRAGVLYRRALSEFTVAGRVYAAGTLFVPRRGAPEGAAAVLAAIATETGLEIHGVATSYSDDGISLGSARMTPVLPARIGLVAGDGVYPTALGSLWHLLDRQVDLPVTLVDGADLASLDLSDFDVLVLPEGWGWDDLLAAEAGDAVERWLDGGGVLVAAGDGPAAVLRERGWTAVEEWQAPEDESVTDPESPEALRTRPLEVPGAVVATEVRTGHPLTLGLTAPPPVLVRGTRPLLATGEPQTDVLTVVSDDPVIAGHAWPESVGRLAGSLLVASETKGDGTVITFAQDPVHRGIWRGTAPLFLNAVMFSPSVEGGQY